MVEVNFNTKTISFNVVLFGPPECGKKTWIEYMHRYIPKPSKVLESSIEHEKTMSFSYEPMEGIKIEKFCHVLNVMTCSLDIHQQPPLVSRILDAADGIVFIADSNPDNSAQNLEYLDFLFEYMKRSGRELTTDKLDAEPVDGKWYSLGKKTLRAFKVPWVLAYNKRDLSNPAGSRTVFRIPLAKTSCLVPSGFSLVRVA